jgi:hypothetical protein
MADINTYRIDYPDNSSNNIKLLFNNKRPIQTRELLELQDIAHRNSRDVFNTLYKNGAVVTGLDITLQTTYLSGIRSFVCSKGVVYIEGQFIELPESTFTVATDNAVIGVLVDEQIITEQQDPRLNDPEKGGELWGAAGAYRVKWAASIAVDASSMYPFARIQGSKVIKITPTDPNKQLLADYIHDAEGNFVVKGFNVTSISSSTNSFNTTNLNNLLQQQANQDAKINTITNQIQILVDSNNAVNALLSQYKQQILVSYTQQLATSIANSEQLIESNTAQINTLQNSLNVLRQANQSLQSDIDVEKNSQVNLETISISPGVGYVEGNRIVKTTNTLLSLPKNLPTSQIYNAVFNYSGTASYTSYQFSNLLLTTLLTNKSLIRVVMNNVVFNGVEHTMQIDINLPSTITSIADIVVFIVNEFNSAITTTTITCSTLSLNNNDLMLAIKQNYEVILTNNSTITFKFITLRNTSTVPDITLNLLKRDANNTIVGAGEGVTITKALTSTSSSSLNSYKLGFTPVSEINRLSATLIATSKPVVRGAVPGTIDNLGQATVTKIVAVGKDFTTYLQDVDFRLINQSQIDWSLPSTKEPAPGTTYFVTYLYTSILTNNVDYKLQNDAIYFINRTPAIGQSFYVDYSYYQTKAGLLTLDRDGNIDYVMSEPGINPAVPSVPDYLLPICEFTLRVNDSSFKSIGLNKYTNKQLHQLREQLTQAVYALEDKPELITDSFLTYTNQDIYNPAYTAAICPNKQALTVGYSYSEVPLSTNEASRYYTDSYISLPHQVLGVSYLNQSRITEYRTLTKQTYKPILRLSSYSLFFNVNSAKINPSNSIAEVQSKINSRIAIYNQSLYGLLGTALEEAFYTNNAFNSNSLDEEIENYISANVKTLSTLSIDLFLTDLEPLSNNYKVYIDGAPLQTSLVMLGSTAVGNIYNSFRAGSNGKASVRMLMPPNLNTGVHTVEVRNVAYSVRTKFSVFNNLLNHVVFDATNAQVLGADTPPYLTEDAYTYNIEQTFIATQTCFLNNIKLFINKAPTVATELTVLLLDEDRNVISYAELTTFVGTTLTAQFLTPCLIEKDKLYRIVLKSPQDGFSFAVAKINAPDLNTGTYFGNQLESNGCLYYSLDGSNAVQLDNYDLSYVVTRDAFTQQSKQILLGTYRLNLATGFALNTRDVIPPLTYINYEYALEDGVWKSFSSNKYTALDFKSNQISIRATLYTDDLAVSPLLLIKGSTLSIYANNSSSTVVSNYFSHGNNYTSVNIKVGYIKPADSQVLVYHAPQSSNEVWSICREVSSVLVDENIGLYESVFTITYSTNATGSKYRVDTVTNDTSKPVTIKYVYVNPIFI